LGFTGMILAEARGVLEAGRRVVKTLLGELASRAWSSGDRSSSVKYRSAHRAELLADGLVVPEPVDMVQASELARRSRKVLDSSRFVLNHRG
jgi:hypothetical protein